MNVRKPSRISAGSMWYGCKGRFSTTVPRYVPPQKSGKKMQEVPVLQSYHAVRPDPNVQYL
jgi:hypothetical protein